MVPETSPRSLYFFPRAFSFAGQIAFLPTGILTTLLGPMPPILIARWALNDTQARNLTPSQRHAGPLQALQLRLYPITVARLPHHFGMAARSIGPVMFSLASVGPAVVPWTVGVISNAAANLRAGLVPLAATQILFLIHLWDW